MKKYLLSLLVILISAGVCFAESREIAISKSFNKISTSSGVDVTYTPSGGKPKIKIVGPASKINDVSVSVKGSTLVISAASKKGKGIFNSINNNLRGVKIAVSGPLVTSFDASSGSSIKCSSSLNSPSAKFKVDASSGATVSLTTLRGARAEFDASSGSSIAIQTLNATKTEFDASSGSKISVNRVTTSNLDADASSGASIKLAGSAQNGYLEASSGGSINALSLKIIHSNIKKSSSGSIKVR